MAGAYHAFDAYEAGLTRRLIGGLTAMPGVRLVGISNSTSSPIGVPTIFTHERVSTHRFAEALAAEDIIWSGHNYALPWEPARHLVFRGGRGGWHRYRSLQ